MQSSSNHQCKKAFYSLWHIPLGSHGSRLGQDISETGCATGANCRCDATAQPSAQLANWLTQACLSARFLASRCPQLPSRYVKGHNTLKALGWTTPCLKRLHMQP